MVVNVFSSLRRVSRHWGKRPALWEAGRGLHWTEQPAVQRRINRKVSGSPVEDPYQYLIRFLKRNGVAMPLRRCLTLGCGRGELERGLAKYDFCRRHDAYDVAERAIESARQAAAAEGLTHVVYRVADINRLSLPSDAYDAVFTVMSAHHFSDLEHVFREVKRALRPDGVFFLNEFIGPTKFQWTDRQLEIVNGLLRVLPPRYRIAQNQRLKTRVRRPTLFRMYVGDPSEAIRSDQIIATLSRHFQIVEQRDYGGTILNLLLSGIAGNFDSRARRDRKLLRMLFDVEDQMLASGNIASDFSVIIARPAAGAT
jgi:SAM-dependent methyltransferase